MLRAVWASRAPAVAGRKANPLVAGTFAPDTHWTIVRRAPRAEAAAAPTVVDGVVAASQRRASSPAGANGVDVVAPLFVGNLAPLDAPLAAGRPHEQQTPSVENLERVRGTCQPRWITRIPSRRASRYLASPTMGTRTCWSRRPSRGSRDRRTRCVSGTPVEPRVAKLLC